MSHDERFHSDAASGKISRISVFIEASRALKSIFLNNSDATKISKPSAIIQKALIKTLKKIIHFVTLSL